MECKAMGRHARKNTLGTSDQRLPPTETLREAEEVKGMAVDRGGNTQVFKAEDAPVTADTASTGATPLDQDSLHK